MPEIKPRWICIMYMPEIKPRRICTTKKCCIYSHFTVLDSAGSKIYRGLVESVGMKKSAGEDDQYSYI